MLMFVCFVVLGCDQGQQMMKPMMTAYLTTEVPLPEPEDEPTTTERFIIHTFYIDGVPHQKTVTVFVSAEAALESGQYKTLIEYYKEWNKQNCGKLQKSFPAKMRGLVRC